MNVYETYDIGGLLSKNAYPGRGIVIGKSEDGKNAVFAYFIMGRSENSRNRVFELRDGEVYTVPYDESKVEDPSLIIYRAVAHFGNYTIVTNGDQTDTIYDALSNGKGFEDALSTRCFEPDKPNFTPRISGMIKYWGGSCCTCSDAKGCQISFDFTYKMSILKSADAEGSACNRYYYNYSALPGLGHFIHTYENDGNPLPTFCGEPERVKIPSSIDDFTNEIWEKLNKDNKISLYVCYVNLESRESDFRLKNKWEEK